MKKALTGLEPLEPRLLLSASPVSGSGDEQLAAALSNDISHVPLLDGETIGGGNDLRNRFGGSTDITFNTTVSRTTNPSLVHSGNGAMLINASIPAGQFGFVITALGGAEPSALYTDTRDLTSFDQLKMMLRNRTGASFTLRLEVKDYRDSNSHRASKLFTIGPSDTWTEISTSLDLASPGWVIVGNPDFTRARQFALLIQADQGQAVSGQVIIDDMALVEPGGVLDPATAPINDLVGRLAKRQFFSLWGATDPSTGGLETNAQNGRMMAMNTTSSLIKLLPGAIERGWVTRGEADAMLAVMVNTMDLTMDNMALQGGGYLPPRYIDRGTFTASGPEESVIDGAFMFLALYGYKSQAGIDPTLKGQIEALLDRFDFASFSLHDGWSFAYNHDSDSFISAGYDGYGGEIWTISLAAHLAQVNHVDITTHFHSGIIRAESYLVDSDNAQFNHAFTQFRPPFVQWLFDLYVDTNDRGLDTYPNASQSTNPFDNAVRYQHDVNDYFQQVGRGLLLQPDAGSSGSQYQQFSAYNDHGEPNVFMPWSVAFSFLGDPQSAEAALRNSLAHNLHGPFGLSDSAIWATGAPEPTSHPANNDLWNTSLATMAFMDYLYDDSHFLNDLPEVQAALDLVFTASPIAGDLNKDGFVGVDDLNIVLTNWNQRVGPGDWLHGDPNGDGFVGVDDLNIVLTHWNNTAPPQVENLAQLEPAVVPVHTTDNATPLQQSRAQRQSQTAQRPQRVGDISQRQHAAMVSWGMQDRLETQRVMPAAGADSSYTPLLSLWEPGDADGEEA